jgi:hypothetical protein
MDLKTVCANYSWGQKHVHDLLKENLPTHLFSLLWKKPLEQMKLPVSLLDHIARIQALKRNVRPNETPSTLIRVDSCPLVVRHAPHAAF